MSKANMTNIRRLIVAAGTQKALADAVGVCQQAVCQWEKNGYIPVGRIPVIVERYPGIVTIQSLINDYMRLYKKNTSNKRIKTKIKQNDVWLAKAISRPDP